MTTDHSVTRRAAIIAMAGAGSLLHGPADAASKAEAVVATPSVKTPLGFRPPPGSCDCHVHVFLDTAKYPYSEKRVYSPPLATAADLLALQRALHMDHVVIVTPSVYGTDNSATLAGMKELGTRRARGVAVIDEKTSSADMDAMVKAGIRGIRINLETTGVTDPEASAKQLDTMVAKIAGRPWHLQMYARLSVIASLKAKFLSLPMPVVFDHFAGADAALGAQQPGFDAVLEMVKSGKAYVKISGAYRASVAKPGYDDVAPLARALIAANPARLVWGSDWPHPDSATVPGRKNTDPAPAQDVDDGRLLSLVGEWTQDAATRRAILVDNPRRLYGFT